MLLQVPYGPFRPYDSLESGVGSIGYWPPIRPDIWTVDTLRPGMNRNDPIGPKGPYPNKKKTSLPTYEV